MDITSVIGPALSIGAILIGMIMEGGQLSSIIQIPAVIIVFGGAFGAMLVAYPMSDVMSSLGALLTWLKAPEIDNGQILDDILDLAQVARKESILALEKKVINFKPLSKAIKLAVDGTDPNIIKSTLENDQDVIMEEKEVQVHFWEDLGAITPTIGILGAVLGLIHVMNHLEGGDVGGGIAIAFVATLYAVGAANILFIPIAKKLKRKAILEKHARDMVMIGVEGILTGLNPKFIEERLSVFVHSQDKES